MLLDISGIRNVLSVLNVFNLLKMDFTLKYVMTKLHRSLKNPLVFPSMKVESIVNEIFKCYLHPVVRNAVRRLASLSFDVDSIII